MKKTLAVILSVLMIFASMSVVVFADDTPAAVICNITFVDYNGTSLSTAAIEYGNRVTAPTNPSREATETTEYTFKGWSADGGTTVYAPATLPLATTDITYTAVYAEKTIEETQSFWNLIQSIFERINMIFQYFYDLFSRGIENFPY